MTKAFRGTLYSSTATFRDSDDAVADPTDLTVTVTEPDGTATTSTYSVSGITRLSEGVYYHEVLLDAVGDWRFKWIGTGDVQAGSDEELVHVPV